MLQKNLSAYTSSFSYVMSPFKKGIKNEPHNTLVSVYLLRYYKCRLVQIQITLLFIQSNHLQSLFLK